MTGIESCPCRADRIQRNHIARALLAQSAEDLAYQGRTTVCQIKHGLLREYLTEQLKNPTARMVIA